MQRRRNNNKRAAVAVVLAASVLLGSGIVAPDAGKAVHAANATTTQAPAASSTSSSSSGAPLMSAGLSTNFEPFFTQTLAEWTKKNYANATSTYRITGADFSSQSHQLAQAGSYQGKDRVLLWKSDRENWVEYKVRVDKEGLYQFNLQYYPYSATQESQLNRRPVMLAVTIDGNYPFREARAVPFRRLFKDDLPVKRDEKGDDIRPRSLGVERWIDEPFRDSANAYNDPLKWYLSAGEHTIRLSGSEAIAISQITLSPPETYVDYKTYASKLPSGQAASAKTISIQAEEMTTKNDAAIQMAVDKDALSMPEAGKHETFNTVGGTRWQTGGQTITWSFNVPESGRYQISMRSKQNTISNMSSFRTIAIDGKVPFQELTAYQFHYDPNWKGVTLSDAEAKPYEFYFEKGDHTLTMTATTGPFQPIIIESEVATSQLRELTAELKALTGNVVDKNRTWKITEDFPELPKRLETIRDQMKVMADDMLKANGIRENVAQILLNAVKDIESYLRYPNEIPYYMDDISSLQTKIGAIRETLIKAPLLLDQIHIVPVGTNPPKMEANFLQKTKTGILNFFRSFSKKEDLTDLEEGSLNVWVNRGRDWVNLLQELSNEMFTPQTGIKVKVSLLPDENLLIYANAAGISPDIALGQPQDKSIDFAMRNALYDLSKFPDFKQVSDQFAPGALLPFYYNKGYYALPEQQSFKVLFYRKDILERLNLKIPDTWDDVYNMLPTLQQNGYNFYVPPTDFITFVYQNRAEFFTKDGMSTALNSPESFQGFKQWTDLFNIYDLDKGNPNFYEHFRRGNMPIGVADYNTYVTMSAAAPELTGWWGIAPLPGIKNSSGVVERWSSGGQTTGFIYESSEKKDAAWQFLKWLVSADVQARYGNDLESFNGITFRWNTANIEAFTKLPWPRDDMKVILEQWKWYKEMPNPPGAYFVGRELNNAWNRTVVDGMNYRESLEEAIVNIDREMVRKEQEFGFVAPDGTVLHTLDLPQVTKPWEGVDRFVPK
ncbi:extracellular solute-binding protein [Paenibacillus hemerocallicola]|uniref:Extracellular solute-binding protein n=1 Tax=Paenibacillus hemerocallicola TaxID=1172614 RepID=A0A5C4T982_9BACL|nr:extracellular solute-binding protein [Paenibacillus hemerocallicola]TNJ65663.1 extracellular solute-binding protein [Paenibacillus hemerocallicola]